MKMYLNGVAFAPITLFAPETGKGNGTGTTAQRLSTEAQAKAMAARVINIAQAMDDDEELLEIMTGLTDASVAVKRGPFLIMKELERIFGDKMSELPVPGSDTGNNPDIYKIGEKRTGSYYNDLYDAFSIGKRQKADVDAITAAMKADGTPYKNSAGKVLNAKELETLRKNINQRRNYGRTNLRNAVGLHFQLEALKELPQVAVQERNSGDPAVQNTLPYLIRDADVVKNPDNYIIASVPTILKLNVAKAKEAGGTFEDLKATLKRQADPETLIPEIDNTGKFEQYTAAYYAYLKKCRDDNALAGKLMAAVGDSDNQDFLLSVFGIADIVNELIVSRPKFKALYAEYTGGADGDESEEETEETETREKAAVA